MKPGVNMQANNRAARLNDRPEKTGPIVYWMSRDMRVSDNWALLFGRELCRMNDSRLVVFCCPAPLPQGAHPRQHSFMLRGLSEVEKALTGFNIPFFFMEGDPVESIRKFIHQYGAAALVTDFTPLRARRRQVRSLAALLDCALYEVDTHNIVPCLRASSRREYAAFTFRPAIHRLLPEYLVEFPLLEGQDPDGVPWPQAGSSIVASLPADPGVSLPDWIKPGETAARKTLRTFTEERLHDYHQKSTDPNSGAVSRLSPFLHFGHLSAQRCVLEVIKAPVPEPARSAFLEQLVVRRELSDNYCFNEENYDRVDSAPDWALKTLDAHRNDPRQFLYRPDQFEDGQTHDELWNAAQAELVNHGTMHNYLRMYWAKKILEWSRSPEEAMDTAVGLNDRYQLDGNDPNGYAGIAWSICGVHDRAFKERSVYGKLRYMSYQGCRRKFDVDAYVARQFHD